MRAVSSSLLAALVVVALFWGNCFSCPQLLLAASQVNERSCCPHSAPRPADKECQTQSLKHFVKADPVTSFAYSLAPVAVAQNFTAAMPALLPDWQFVERQPHSPPDLQALNVTFRI